MNWQRRALAECPAQPWRNGGGLTHELATWPTTDEWRWRVSVARIDQDGPFSAFPGVERWFAVLEGGGVALQWPERRQVLHAHEPPLAFAGEPACEAQLLAGPTLDFNLMARGLRGGLQRQTQTGAQAPWPAHAHVGVFACTAVAWQADGQAQALAPREFAWTHTTALTPWHWQAGEALLFVLQEASTP